MADIGTYDSTTVAGTTSLAVSSVAASYGGAATAYTVYDLYGNIVGSGTITGGSGTIEATAGTWPLGWTLCLFTAPWSGNSGYVSDSLGIASFRSSSPLPAPPAAGTSPNAIDPDNRGMDQYMHSFTAMGPNRWQIHDTANPVTGGGVLTAALTTAEPIKALAVTGEHATGIGMAISAGSRISLTSGLHTQDWNVAAPLAITGNITNGQPTVTNIGSTAPFEVGDALTGTDIPAGASIQTIDSATQITMTANATKTVTPEPITVTPPPAVAGTTHLRVSLQTPNFAYPVGTILFVYGEEQAATVPNIAASLALEQGAAGYTNPTFADPVRPRTQFVTFPLNQASEGGYAAGVTATVAALGPGTASNVSHFEGLNEPVNDGLSPAQSAAQYNAFRIAVKAGNASAKVMGPCEVCYAPNGSSLTPQIADLSTFLANITPGTLDVFSLHDYNCCNGDFIATDGWFSALRQTLDTAGYSGIEIWLTEIGWIGTGDWSLFDPRRAVQWLAVLLLTGERWGIPKEHMSWFYDLNVPGGPVTSWMKELNGSLRPTALFFRVYSEEIFGKTYSAGLDFGAIGNNFYRGNVYQGTDGTCVALIAQGNPGDTVTLAISDSGPITISDWEGKTSTVTVVAGEITLPILDLATYVRLSAGCTVSVVDAGNGLVAGLPTDIAGAATATSGSDAASPELVNDGNYQTGGYLPSPDIVFMSANLPDYVALEWSTPQTIKKLLIRQLAPWSNFPGPYGASAMLEGKLEYWNGSGWLPCPTVVKDGNHWDERGHYSNSTATSFLGQAGDYPYRITFYDQNWCHNVDFSVAIKTTKLRWTVTRTGYGHVPDLESAIFAPYHFINFFKPQLMCSEIVVLSTDDVPTPTYGPFAA